MKYPSVIFSLFFSLIAKSQGLNDIEKNLKTVETAKSTYRQILKQLDDGLVEYNTVEIDTKGRETESFYRFSFADIDKNTVRSITKKDVIIVQLLVGGKQKLIQQITEGGDKISYLSGLNMFVTNAENGSQLEKVIREHIPYSISLEENRLSLQTYNDHINWLLNNIGAVELPKRQIAQKASSNNIAGKLIIDQTFNSKNKVKNELRESNLSILNPNSVRYKISGDEFVIYADSRRNINGIRYMEDGEQKNYHHDLKIYATSITNGKDIYKVLKSIIPLAETKFKQERPKIQNENGALSFLNKTITEVSAGQTTISQNLSIKNNVAHLVQTENQPDKNITYSYNFNFGDVNAANIDFDGQKDKLFAAIPIKKSVNFIQKIKNGELENYTDEIKIYFNTIEDAISGVEALKVLSTLYETKIEQKEYKTKSISVAVDRLKKLMQKVKIGDDTYDVFIELDDLNTKNLKFTSIFSNLKKSSETIQEFSLSDINPKNCSIQIKGKHVIAELNTKHLEKVVKTYVDGQIKPYQYKISIEAKGIEEARDIISIFKTLAEPK